MHKHKFKQIGQELFGNWGWQTRMAEEFGVSLSTIKRWLNGTTPIPKPIELLLDRLMKDKG